MTLRIQYDMLFGNWAVEYFNSYSKIWHVCRDYYPKTGRDFASFNSEDEAIEFMNWKYQKAEDAQRNRIDISNFTVPSDYYGVAGRYYGD